MTSALSTVAEPEQRLPAIRGGIPPAPQRTAALIGYLHNNLEPIPGNFRRYALSAAAAPTDEQRGLLLDRRSEIDAGLKGADDITIRENVGILRSSMATAPLGPEAMQLAKQGFIMVLGQYPAWAVVETTMRFLSGRTGNGTYAPTAAEMANVCRELISGHLAERARINAILDAEVYHVASEADRAEINRAHAEFVAETTKRAAAPTGPAPEPLPERRDSKLAADLERRRARREAGKREGAPAPASALSEEDGET
ncbi:hypothetical protein SAMN04488125_11082 [Methylorubrum salsuginis]|uniref:Uncharacterized protein n=1 Tax=Methylorubrum salsuginis TaxID=414703 RepID=A0A1I4FMT7_9HYPH|nr:hypothetical protein SAMN04488125_11082 [Methylorubrum salsuginis]